MKWPCWDKLLLNFNWHMSSITLWRASLSNCLFLNLCFFSLLVRADALVLKLKKKVEQTKEILIIFLYRWQMVSTNLDLHFFYFFIFILPAKFYVELTIFSGFCQYKKNHIHHSWHPNLPKVSQNTWPYHDINDETGVF